VTRSLSADVDAAAVATPFCAPPTTTQRTSYDVGVGPDVGAAHDTVRVIWAGALVLPQVPAVTDGVNVRSVRGAFGTGTGVGVDDGVGVGFDDGVVTGAAGADDRVGVDECVAPPVAPVVVDLVDDGAGVEVLVREPEGFGVGVGLCETVPDDGDAVGLATDGPSSPRNATSPRARTAIPATTAQALIRRRAVGSAATGVRTVASSDAAAAASHPVIVRSPV
jgi:hypothetical protein